MATHTSILDWRILEQRSLVGYSPWGPEESDMTEQLTLGEKSNGRVIFRAFEGGS